MFNKIKTFHLLRLFTEDPIFNYKPKNTSRSSLINYLKTTSKLRPTSTSIDLKIVCSFLKNTGWTRKPRSRKTTLISSISTKKLNPSATFSWPRFLNRAEWKSLKKRNWTIWKNNKLNFSNGSMPNSPKSKDLKLLSKERKMKLQEETFNLELIKNNRNSYIKK